jgi:hypothetical protein
MRVPVQGRHRGPVNPSTRYQQGLPIHTQTQTHSRTCLNVCMCVCLFLCTVSTPSCEWVAVAR